MTHEKTFVKTYVLVHGGFHGGWCWHHVAHALRARGHSVFTPTQTGCGERAHLISKSITLDTFVDDIANVFLWEDLRDVILVGHSFGGNSISGVADRMPERIRQLIYLDAVMLEGGQTMFGQMPPEVAASRLKAAQASGGVGIAPPEAAYFGIVDPATGRVRAGPPDCAAPGRLHLAVEPGPSRWQWLARRVRAVHRPGFGHAAILTGLGESQGNDNGGDQDRA